MRRRRAIHGCLRSQCWQCSALPAGRRPRPTMLEPYQMVRSLQLVQDSIAAGDHAALPMQRKLLETDRPAVSRGEIAGLHRRAQLSGDAGLRHERRQSGDDRFHAGEAASRRDRPRARHRHSRLSAWRRHDRARRARAGRSAARSRRSSAPSWRWSKVPSRLPTIRLLAQRMFDVARLLSPGTLVEEAALRRSIALASETKDVTHFLVSCSQYVRRFLQSPYASQFADALSPAWSHCAQTIDLGGGRRHHRRDGSGAAESDLSQACPTRGDRRPFRVSPNTHPPRPRRSRSKAPNREPIRARCSIPASPRSHRTLSTRSLPS